MGWPEDASGLTTGAIADTFFHAPASEGNN